MRFRSLNNFLRHSSSSIDPFPSSETGEISSFDSRVGETPVLDELDDPDTSTGLIPFRNAIATSLNVCRDGSPLGSLISDLTSPIIPI
mmetsp:Transcript_9382/g.14437  ORF Transcript_9382/g.14437 Transcript_9382/m.14437 type:complete len:88 (+) Transcript_9382:645-908(+)